MDLLFSVNFNDKTGYIWILTEHQSKPDLLISLRMQKYMLRICSEHLKNNPKSNLPAIYPILFYSGQVKYSSPMSFWDLFEDPTLAKSFFTKPIQLIDVSKLTKLTL